MSKAGVLGCVVGLLVLLVSMSLGGRPDETMVDRPVDPALMLEKSVLGSGGSPGVSESWILNGTLGQVACDRCGVNPLSTGFWSLLPGTIPALSGLTGLPAVDYLCQNFPNPFRLSTTIRYALTKECATGVFVFDVQGRRVKTLMRGTQGPGRYSVVWDGCDESGREVASGVYFYRLDTDGRRTVRKMVFAR